SRRSVSAAPAERAPASHGMTFTQPGSPASCVPSHDVRPTPAELAPKKVLAWYQTWLYESMPNARKFGCGAMRAWKKSNSAALHTCGLGLPKKKQIDGSW